MRRSCSLVLPLLLAGQLSGCSSVPLVGDWFAGDDAEEPAELVELSPEIAVRTLWTTEVGDGVGEQRVKLVPRVYLDRVFAVDREGVVEALDAETGQTVWKVEHELAVSAGPGVGGGLVLLGTSDAEVVALDDTSGEHKWTARVSSEVLAVPQTDRGIVVVQTIDGRVSGLDAADGALLWSYVRAPPTLTLRGSSSPLIHGGGVICGFAGGKLVALELETGRVFWETTVTAPSGRSELERMADIDADLVIEDGVVYVAAYQGDVAAVAQATGVVLWRRELSSHAGVSADWRRLYVTSSDDEVWALDLRSASAVWKQDKLRARRLSAPAIIDDFVVVGDLEGYLHWLAKDDGRMVARTRLGSDPISTQPAVAGGVLYVYGDGGDLGAFAPAGLSGAERE